MPIDLKPGELEIIERSSEMAQYKCGHTAAASFKLRMGDWDLTSPLIRQTNECPDCAFARTHGHLHRCPECGKVYEVVPGASTVAISSFRHFSACFPSVASVSRQELTGRVLEEFECGCFCHIPGNNSMHIVACCDGKCPDCSMYIASGRTEAHRAKEHGEQPTARQ